MKYLTREWYYGNKDICLDLEVDSNAEQLSEEYYKELYNAKLNAFLEEEKEVSEMVLKLLCILYHIVLVCNLNPEYLTAPSMRM